MQCWYFPVSEMLRGPGELKFGENVMNQKYFVRPSSNSQFRGILYLDLRLSMCLSRIYAIHSDHPKRAATGIKTSKFLKSSLLRALRKNNYLEL